jgi:leucyl-tRNA synthetase
MQTLMLAPIAPHICEEIWEKPGKSELIFLKTWSLVDEGALSEEVEKAEEIAKKVQGDLEEVLGLVKEKRRITLVLPAKWKYDFVRKVAAQAKEKGGIALAARSAQGAASGTSRKSRKAC